ncbi:hypothetical protein CMV_007836 [Castanea mollissima]|uniref:CCHC-type domain-containing protein n=1 Tax=Castanea mollissima TaxID=60419 RepID=A0A8J4RDB6_9ROSI|nr:hypothetical protein CMV_007836 [Castanea mollissima]
MGEIPGAYTQAFSFEELMDDDAESDDEVETLQQGMVAVKFSKEFKQEIRRPWARALIVKVYGRVVEFNFLQAKLLSLWKPAGRLDVVDLGHGFFLTRLSLREDFENVLKKGPWFIGEHFLLLRPWEPDFKPASANVSSIAVWIRLSELPIEYYNAKALQHIGKAIGNVLRIDTFTANETRGKFARLCIQVDVDKPLITTIMIGKLQQTVTYEGIHKLCFECGRMGHRRETCPYVVRPVPPCEEAEMGGTGERGASSQAVHVADNTEVEVGPNGKEHDVVLEDVHEGSYGPWVVVARRKNKTKVQRSGGSLPDQGPAFDRRSNGFQDGMEKASGPIRPNRETKRKLSPLRILDKAQVEQVVQKLGKEAIIQAQPNSAQNLKLKEPKFDAAHNALALCQRKPNSVKSMKDFVRARAHKTYLSCVVGEENMSAVVVGQSKELSAQKLKGGEFGYGVSELTIAGNFKFAATTKTEIGQKNRGSSGGFFEDRFGQDSSKLNTVFELVQDKGQEGLEDFIPADREECDRGGDGLPASCDIQSAHYF